jgi:hypothetical protein
VKLECGWNWPRVISDGWLCACSVEHSIIENLTTFTVYSYSYLFQIQFIQTQIANTIIGYRSRHNK